MQTDAALRNYLSLIAARQGGIEGLLSSLNPTPTPSAHSGFETFDGTTPSAARSALEKLAAAAKPALSLQERSALEAIIDEELRPAFDVVDGTFAAGHPRWEHLNSDVQIKARMERILPSVGRVDLVGHPKFPYAGTGFVVGHDLLMTNRHVAEVFARGTGVRQLDFLPGMGAGVNPRCETGRPAGPTFGVRRVVMIHPYWDMALLEVPGISSGRSVMELSVEDARELLGREIAVVGYPAFDPRNPPNVQQQIFGANFGVKKLQPGELQGEHRTPSYGKLVSAATHDCSTLSGNSGSALIDLSTGTALGLHFGGRYHERNYAVPSAALAADSRVVDAGVRFAGATGGPHDWASWWSRSDAEEASRSVEGGEGAPPPATTIKLAAPQVLVSAAGGTIQLRLPGPLEMTFEALEGDVNSTSSVDEQEGLREPFHDESYESRTGFDSAFLGEEGSLCVSLPEAADPDMVAPTKDGQTILHYQNFSIVMHRHRRIALFTAANISREPELRAPSPGKKYGRKQLAGLAENDQEKWFLDPRLDAQYQLPDVFFTKDRKAFDKGHLVRRDDVAWGETYDDLRRANGDSYHVTNCSPQVANFNRSNLGEDNWGDLENHVLKSAASERLSVFAGPVLAKTDQVFTGVGGRGSVIRARIPSRYWKIIVARGGDGLQAYGFVLEQDLSAVEWEFLVPDEFVATMRPIGEIQELTGLTFDESLHSADQYDVTVGIELAMQGATMAVQQEHRS